VLRVLRVLRFERCVLRVAFCFCLLRLMYTYRGTILKTLDFLDSRKPPIPPPLTPLARIIGADGWIHKKWFRVKVHLWNKCIKSGVSKASFCVPSWSSMKVQSWAFLRFGLFLWGHLIPSDGSILRFFAFWFVFVRREMSATDPSGEPKNV